MVKVWDVASWEELRTLWDHVGEVDDVAFSPDGTRLATAATAERTVKVWDANSGQKLLTLSGHDNGVIRLAFSPDGRRMATASADGTARVWDATTGKELLSLGHPERVWGIAYSSDGSRLATASWDQTARMWDVTPSQEVLTLSGGPGSRGGMAFSAKGTHLAVTSSLAQQKYGTSPPARRCSPSPVLTTLRSVLWPLALGGRSWPRLALIGR